VHSRQHCCLLTLFLLCGNFALAEPTQQSATNGSTSDWNLVGEASFRVWTIHIYDIRLKTPSGLYEPGNFPLELEIIYRKNVAAKKLLASTEEEWRKHSIPMAKIERWLVELQSIWPDIAAGDSLALQVNPSQGLFFHNGKPIGTTENRELLAAFLAIWLSEKTSQPQLRKDILGNNT